MGAPNPTSNSGSSTGSSVSPNGSSSSEKWLVRILLTVAFGLAFGIEGMTLIRSFVLDDEESDAQTTTEEHAVLREGDVLLPSFGLPIRAHRLGVRAGRDDWTFRLVARPDTMMDHPYTLTFERVTTGNGTTRTTGPSHTWAPGDTVSFAASWAFPVGQRPETLTITGTAVISDDSTATASRRVKVGHVPVRKE